MEKHLLKGSGGDVLCAQQAHREAPDGEHQRIRRSVLHKALLEKIPAAIIHLNKRLESLSERDESKRFTLKFKDGTEIKADLVIGADGVRSRVREQAFPEAAIRFTGVTAYRALVPLSKVSAIPSFDHTKTTLWYIPQKGYVYSPIEDDQAGDYKCELVLRDISGPLKPADAQKMDIPVPNGVKVDNATVEEIFRDCEPAAKQLLTCVPEGGWIKYASFAGPPLPSSVKGSMIILIGGAANPMSGAFGSGATFGLQDGWTFGNALARYLKSGAKDPISKALATFDAIRQPYYQALYKSLGNMLAQGRLIAEKDGCEASWVDFANRHYSKDLDWIYHLNIEQSLDKFFEQDQIAKYVTQGREESAVVSVKA